MAWLIPSAQVAGGPLLELSPQQLLTCTPNPQHCGGEGGCEGATQALAFNYTRRISAASGGIKLSSAYGYKPEQARDTTAPALLPRCVPLPSGGPSPPPPLAVHPALGPSPPAGDFLREVHRLQEVAVLRSPVQTPWEILKFHDFPLIFDGN